MYFCVNIDNPATFREVIVFKSCTFKDRPSSDSGLKLTDLKNYVLSVSLISWPHIILKICLNFMGIDPAVAKI